MAVLQKINNLSSKLRNLQIHRCLAISNKNDSMPSLLPPKRPQTAFINYFNDSRLTIIKQNPGIVFADVSRLAGKQWKLLPETKRKQYMDKWNENKIMYKKTMDSFMTNLSKEDKIMLDKKIDEKKKKKLAAKHKLEFTKKLGEEWRKLAENQKMPYTNKALNNQQLYQKNLRVWEKEMLSDGRPELVRSEFREKKSKKSVKN